MLYLKIICLTKCFCVYVCVCVRVRVCVCVCVCAKSTNNSNYRVDKLLSRMDSTNVYEQGHFLEQCAVSERAVSS